MQRLEEEKNEAGENVHEYKASNNALEKYVAHKQLPSNVALQEMRRLQMELTKTKGENELLTRPTEEFWKKTAVTTKFTRRTSYKLAEIVASKHTRAVMGTGWKISGWASAKVSRLTVGCEYTMREWRGSEEEAAGHYVAITLTGKLRHTYQEHQ